MSNSDYTSLHNHSHHSLQDALPTPEQLILGVKELGQTAIAITDHGRMGGHLSFVDAGRKNGIKPILGCEFYFAKNRHEKASTDESGVKKPREKLAHLTILAQNPIGYKNLLQLGYEASSPDCYYYFPRIDFDYLSQHSDGLIVLSGCLGSELNQTLLRPSSYEEGLRVAKKYKELFGERYFIELQYHGIEEQKNNLPQLVKIAKELDIKMVASNDVHYIKPEDWKLHDVLIQMKDLRDDKGGNKNSGKKEAYGSHQFYLKSYDEMFKIFGDKVPESILNTKLIEEMVEDYYKIDVPHLLPEAKINIENKSFVNFWKAKLPHCESKEAYLAFTAFTGLKELGLEKNPDYVKRLKYEINTIWNMSVTDYFLIQKEMIDYMKEQNIMFGVRGSGGGSLLNYCLGISDADPVKLGLIFERFLNPGRGNQYKIDLENFISDKLLDESESINWIRLLCKEFLAKEENFKYESRISRELWILENQKMCAILKSAVNSNFKLNKNTSNFIVFYIVGITDKIPSGDLIIEKVSPLPDIDMDIADDKRDQVIEWAKQRFGEENVKAVGTWGTYQSKAAVLGTLKTSEKFKKQYANNLAQMAQKVSSSIPNKPGTTIESAIKDSSDFAYWASRFPEEIKNASKLNGTISNLGLHASAIVISKKPIHSTVPIENSKGTLCTAFDMNNVERTGNVKYDLLGLVTYRQIVIAIKMIKERRGIDINLLNIPLDDQKIFKTVFEKGNTVTIFQFSGPGMQKTLKTVKASELNDLIAIVSLFRPGPMDYISDYAKGKSNPSAIKYAHPIIEKHLSFTYGIMVYQDQAMLLAREMANLDWGDVDKLRKAISKKSGKQFDEACANFSSKALARGIPQASVNEVLQLMSKFGGYAFNKAHAALYALLAYRTAFLKTYYPEEWLAACIESLKKDPKKEEKNELYMAECERLSIKVSPPSVNESSMNTTVSDNGTIYLPITSLKGIGDSGSSIIENKPYKNLNDFVQRSGCNKSIFVALAAGGAMNCLVDDPDVDEDYFLDFWLEYSKSKAKSKKSSVAISLNNNNNLSLLKMREISQKNKGDKSDLMSMLDDF